MAPLPVRAPARDVLLSLPLVACDNYSLFPIPYSLFPTPYSLLPTPYSLLPTAFSLSSQEKKKNFKKFALTAL